MTIRRGHHRPAVYRQIMKSAAAALALWALGVSPLAASLAVYDLNFNNTLTTINYSFVQDGYLVIDADAGTFGSVLVLRDPDSGELYSSTSLLSGTYTLMTRERDGRRFGVATSYGGGGDEVSNLAFQIIGRLDGDGMRSVGAGVRIPVPLSFRGFLLAFAPEELVDEAFAYGFAGQSRVSAGLDEGLTIWSNFNGWSQAETVTNIQDLLENNGTLPVPTPTPSPSPSPSPSPTASPSPTPSDQP